METNPELSIDTIVVKTKLFIPRLPSNNIHRPRLIEIINQGSQNKWTLVTAPAGFGKSTLLADWAYQSKDPVCWLTLDSSENDPLILFSNLISSIQTQFPDFGSSIQMALNSPGAPDLFTLINMLTNEINAIKRDFSIVLDDFQRIEKVSSIDAMSYLLNHQPPNLHLIISSRKETSVFGIRRHAYGELTQLGVNDLRFTSDEIARFFHQRFGMRISEDELNILEYRTEGWIAGLQMAAISMQSVNDLKAFVHDFNADNRMVKDYLLDEVLSHQEFEIQEFLLKTSILRVFSTPLCDYLTATTTSQDILDTLEQRNLFLIPLDNTGTWYRYHHLFANLLQNRLEEVYPDQLSILRQKASDWYLAHDMPEDSVDQIFANQDYQSILLRIEQVSGTMLAKGRFKVFIEWLERMPKWYLERTPYLVLVQAYMLFELSDIYGCRRLLEMLADSLEYLSSPDTEDIDREKTTLKGVYSAVSCAYFYGGEGDVAKSYRSAAIALEYLPEKMSYWRTLALQVVGLYHQWREDYDTSIEYFKKATDLSLHETNLFLGFIAISILAKLFLKTGQILKAVEICQKAIEIDSSRGFYSANSGLIYLTMSELYLLRGDFEVSERYASQGIDLVEKHREVHSIIKGYFILARVFLSTGRKEQAHEIMSGLVSRIRDYSPTNNALTQAFACQAYIWIYSGYLKHASRWKASPDHDRFNTEYPFDVNSNYAYRGVYLAPQDLISEFIEFVQFTEARLCYALGDLETADRIIDSTLQKTGNKKRVYSRIQFLILSALVQSGMGHLNDATATLFEAINLAVPEKLCQPFVQEKQGMIPLLNSIARKLQEDDPFSIQSVYNLQFIDELLACIAKMEKQVDKFNRHNLTQREIQVVQWLARGLSYSETAQQMSISENTLRTHIKRVYKKLGVNNRLQAVTSAEKIGLLEKVQL